MTEKKCSLCDNKHVAKGLCSKHYELERSKTRYKTKNLTFHMTIDEKIDFLSTPITETGCIIWLGNTDKEGYGRIQINKKLIRVHRLTYSIAYGEIKDGMVICHKCDIPSCINPLHLFCGTYLQNVQDRTNKNRGIKGSKVGISKLNESDIKSIRSDKRTQYAVSRDYNVSQVLIGQIKLGKIWKHV